MTEQCALENKMLQHFGFVRIYEHCERSVDGVITTRRERITDDMLEVNKALAISQAFFDLSDPDKPDSPIDPEEMVLAIRYKMGYGWWAWLFVKHFAIPIIRWLWNEYHKPDGVGSFTTTSEWPPLKRSKS